MDNPVLKALEEKFEFDLEKQILFDNDGGLRTLDQIIGSIISSFRRKNIPKHEMMPINTSFVEMLGYPCPLGIQKIQAGTSIGYELLIGNGNSKNIINIEFMLKVYATQNHLERASVDLRQKIAEKLSGILKSNSPKEKRARQFLEYWHKTIEHKANNAFSMDAIAGIALHTGSDDISPCVKKSAHNIKIFSDAEKNRLSFNNSSAAKNDYHKRKYPVTNQIISKKGLIENTSSVEIYFDPGIITTGLLVCRGKVNMVSTARYTLIEMTAPATLLQSCHGRPLRELIDHPILNKTPIIIDTIEIEPPKDAFEPEGIEAEAFEAMLSEYIWHDNPAPGIGQWFQLKSGAWQDCKPMVKINHKPMDLIPITEEEAKEFQVI